MAGGVKAKIDVLAFGRGQITAGRRPCEPQIIFSGEVLLRAAGKQKAGAAHAHRPLLLLGARGPSPRARRAAAPSVQLDLHIDACRQFELHQRVHRLVGRVQDVHQALVRAQFELVASILVGVR